MFRFVTLFFSLVSVSALASNYPADYCYANVRICEDGPAVFAQVSSGCNSGVYIIGYKKAGMLGQGAYVDAVAKFHMGNNAPVNLNFRISPDWNSLGFLTSGLSVWDFYGMAGRGPVTEVAIAFSDSYGNWDSRNGANYHFPIGNYNAETCYNVKTSENYYSMVPFAAWGVINEAMKR